MKKLKLSFNNFPFKIFEQGFNCRFSAKFSTFQKKKSVYTELEQNAPFRYLSATIVILSYVDIEICRQQKTNDGN
jgi:hypothetical protein